MKFYATSGHAYDIRTQLINDINSSGTAANDTLLYLYDTNGTTQLAFNDDVGQTTWYMGNYYYRESRIQWTAPASGWYYVRELWRQRQAIRSMTATNTSGGSRIPRPRPHRPQPEVLANDVPAASGSGPHVTGMSSPLTRGEGSFP